MIDLLKMHMNLEVVTEAEHTRGGKTTLRDYMDKIRSADATLRVIAENKRRRAAESSRQYAPPPPRQNTPQRTPTVTPAFQNTRPPPGTTSGGQGKPMTLDQAHALGVCVKCGKPGHIGKVCRSKPMQVRQTAQLEEVPEEVTRETPVYNAASEAVKFLQGLDAHHRQVLMEQLGAMAQKDFQPASK